MPQRKCLFIGHRLHEGVGHSHREIEILKAATVELDVDEFQNIGVIDPQHAHVAPRRLPPWRMFSVAQSKIRMNDTGPDAPPPVEATRSPRRAQSRERKSRASSRLLDQRHQLQRVEDFAHAVFDRQHETGGKLPERNSRVHQRGRVREEFEFRKQAEKRLFEPGRSRSAAVAKFGGCDAPGHAAKQLFG